MALQRDGSRLISRNVRIQCRVGLCFNIHVVIVLPLALHVFHGSYEFPRRIQLSDVKCDDPSMLAWSLAVICTCSSAARVACLPRQLGNTVVNTFDTAYGARHSALFFGTGCSCLIFYWSLPIILFQLRLELPHVCTHLTRLMLKCISSYLEQVALVLAFVQAPSD